MLEDGVLAIGVTCRSVLVPGHPPDRRDHVPAELTVQGGATPSRREAEAAGRSALRPPRAAAPGRPAHPVRGRGRLAVHPMGSPTSPWSCAAGARTRPASTPPTGCTPGSRTASFSSPS